MLILKLDAIPSVFNKFPKYYQVIIICNIINFNVNCSLSHYCFSYIQSNQKKKKCRTLNLEKLWEKRETINIENVNAFMTSTLESNDLIEVTHKDAFIQTDDVILNWDIWKQSSEKVNKDFITESKATFGQNTEFERFGSNFKKQRYFWYTL